MSDAVLSATGLVKRYGEKVAVRGRLSANHLYAVRDAAIAGHGIALLPTLACRSALDDGSLEAILPDAAPPAVPIHMCYAAGRMLPAAVRAFVDFAKARFAEIGLGAPADA